MLNASLAQGLLTLFSPSGERGKLTILLFHKIPLVADALTPDEFTLESFERVLNSLSETCNVMPLSEAIDAMTNGRLPARAVCITFDDGYADWLETAAPALKKFGFPATFFIATEHLEGAPLWHERIISAVRALPQNQITLPFGFAKYRNLANLQSRIHLVAELQERLKYAPLSERLATIEMLEAQAASPLMYPTRFDAAAIRTLHAQGFEIGAHTIRHPILNECTIEEARDEISGSRKKLEAIISSPIQYFAYPNGRPLRDYRREHVNLVKEAGYLGAVATGGGAATGESDLFQLPRFSLWATEGIQLSLQLARNASSANNRVPTAYHNDMGGAISEVRCLLVASTFPPIHGGSAVVYGNLCEKLPPGTIRVLAAKNNYLTHSEIPGWRQHDEVASYPIDRLPYLRPRMLPPPRNTWISVYRFLFQDIPLYFRVLITAAAIVRRHKINSICIGELVTGSWLGIALRRLFGCKLIIYVHGEEVTTTTGGRLHGRRRKHYLRVADKVIAVSSFTCDALTQEMGLPPEAVALIENGVDTDRFTPGPRDENFLAQHNLADKRIILTVGRLVPRKGIDMTIRAMPDVLKQIPNAHYVVVGGGEYREALERLIEVEKMEGHVTLAGMIPDEDLLRYLRACDLFVMANRTMPDGDTEGFGLVFREANACGKAVVGGRAGGAVEAVLDGETGLLVDGSNPQEIANAISQLLGDEPMRNTMGTNGLKLALESNTKAVSDRFLKICERLLRVNVT